MLNPFRSVVRSVVESRLSIGCGLMLAGSLLFLFAPGVSAQEIRVDVGGGYSVPTNNVDQEVEVTLNGRRGILVQNVDLQPGPHAYANVGFVRSIGDKFALGARVRAHVSRLPSTVDCALDGRCDPPDGFLQVATIEGRIIVTSPDWIRPYLLVGLGVVHTSVEGVTLREVSVGDQTRTIRLPDVSVTDAGGDVGLGASIPVYGSLYLDTEVRVTGGLPGGKENAVTTLPFTIGLSYGF